MSVTTSHISRSADNEAAKNHWKMRPVGELLKKVGKPVEVDVANEYREIGIRSHCKGIFHKSPVLGTTLGAKRVFWVEQGCLIFNIVFAWEHAVALTTDKEKGLIASHRFPMYQSSNDSLLPQYAYLHFSSPRGKYDLGIASPGGAGRNKTLGQEEFKNLELLVPPIEYQRFAVNVIDTWSKAISTTSALLEAENRLKRSLMQQLLTGKKRFAGKSSDWAAYNLSELGRFSKGAGISKAEAISEGLPAVRYGELYTTHHVVIKKFTTKISPKNAKRSRRISQGDILMAGSGETPEEIGKAAAFLDSLEAYAGGDIVIFSPDKKKVDSLFLSYVLNSSFVRRYIQSRAQGHSVVHLYRKGLEDLRVMIPTIEEQRKIAGTLAAIDHEIDVLTVYMEALGREKRGLVQKLLKGQIRMKE